jgi:hypothetical protein
MLVPLAVSLTSCASPKRQFEIAEVVSVEAQALEELRSTPDAFAVNPADDVSTWTRAKIFFENYGGGKPVLTSTQMKSPPSTSLKVRYIVSKHWNKGTFNYKVTANTPGSVTPKDRLSLYAKNLSRFLQTGHLDLSLIQ